MLKKVIVITGVVVFAAFSAKALERPGVEFKIYQFPATMIPVIDGKIDDWTIVPDAYRVGTEELKDTEAGQQMDKNDLDISVRVGWVKGLPRLYFLYEAYDDRWDFKRPGLVGDIFEIVVDADLSGGPLIPELRQDLKMEKWPGHLFRGVHAQNYHIFTPAFQKKWAMVWGCQPWIADLPWANYAYSYNFDAGESGRMVLEFWITPFDYAPYEGPGRAVISKLNENEIIGLSWSILERDFEERGTKLPFWTISHKTTMYGNASELVAFRLLPLDKQFIKPIEADWEFKIIDLDRRIVAFIDKSRGAITSWKWDFGDGEGSTEQNPIHQYKEGGTQRTVNLTVAGPEGEDSYAIIWDVALK